MNVHFARALGVALALSCAPAAYAVDAPDGVERRLLSDDFFLALGTFVADFETSAQAGRNFLQGSIEFEDELALDPDSSTFRVDGFYRFSPKHSIDFGNFSLNRSGGTTLDHQIIFNDVTYDIGATVTTDFDVDLYRLTYRYSFVNTGRTEAGFIVGLSTYGFTAGVEGEATIDDGGGGTTLAIVRAEEEVLAPIPAWGMHITHAFTKRLVLRANASFFNLEAGDYEGRVVDTSALLDWYFSRHVGIGAGVNNTNIEFADEGETQFEVTYKQDGLLAYVAVVF